MTPEQLTVLAGVLLSLLFAYGPGVKDWFDGKAGTEKRLIMLGALAVISLGIFGANCAGLSLDGTVIACSKDGLWGLVKVFAGAAILNQTTFSLTTASSAARKSAQSVLGQPDKKA